jgi:hypothetical protein
LERTKDIRVIVEQFLGTKKEMVGTGDFVQTEQPDEYEWRRLLAVAGEVVDAQIRVIAYPDSNPREFRILVLHCGHCIARIDYVFGRDGVHINDFNRPMGYPSLPIRAPHIHRWDGNRHLARVDKYSEKLLYAV